MNNNKGWGPQIIIILGMGGPYFVQGGPHTWGWGSLYIYEYRDGSQYNSIGDGSPKVRGPQYYMTPVQL